MIPSRQSRELVHGSPKITHTYIVVCAKFSLQVITMHVALPISSGGLPIRQNRQLPKARHDAGARPVQRKARKLFY